MIVVDSSAILAFLLREPGHDVVGSQLAELAISAVNLAEVLARMSREGIAPRLLAPRIKQLGMKIVEYDEEQAVLAAELRERARNRGVGLGDCCCIALALYKALPVLTGDRIWSRLSLGIEIRLIR